MLLINHDSFYLNYSNKTYNEWLSGYKFYWGLLVAGLLIINLFLRASSGILSLGFGAYFIKKRVLKLFFKKKIHVKLMINTWK